MGIKYYASTKLECTNTEVVKAFCEDGQVKYREGDKKVFCRSLFDVPFSNVKRISKLYPEELICCQFELSAYFDEIYMEFKGGIERLIDYKINYIFEGPKINDEKIEQKIKDKITEFFKVLEVPEIADPHGFGIIHISRSKEVVTYKFELESHDPLERYRVEARKNENHINMKVFKGNTVFEWIDLEESNDSGYIVLPC